MAAEPWGALPCLLNSPSHFASLLRLLQCALPPAAAVSRTDASLMSGSTAAWVETVSTNVLGTAMVTREAVQDMEQRQQWGHIVSIACAEEGSGMHAVTKQAACTIAQELRWVW